MPLPKSVVKINKKGVTYTSSVDRSKYLLSELNRAALRDVARFIKYTISTEFRKLPGMKRGKKFKAAFQHWLRKQEGDLQIGIRHNTWYGVDQELGNNNQPKRELLRTAVFNNIDEIRKIEGQYLSSIENENIALGLINEEEEQE
jgi:hypothetical protein